MKTNEPTNAISYYSKLVGVTFEGRQGIIAELTGNEPARFRREPENEYDPNAVAVDVLFSETTQGQGDNVDIYQDSRWVPIGYIARDKNSELAETLTSGRRAAIQISEITGGEWDKAHKKQKSFGVNVYITYEAKRKLVRTADACLVKDIFDNEVFYDDVKHQYTNSLGEVYLSGSVFAAQSEKPFDAEFLSGMMAKKAGLTDEDAQTIRDMWRLKANASASFGTAIHAALELYGKYKSIADKLGKETHLHDNVAINKAVVGFYEEYPDTTDIEYEALVVDHKKKRAGRIDRLEYEEDGVWIADFKTNYDVKKSLKKYWLQLSFYAAILKANGLTVKGLKIYHYNGETWNTILGEVIDIDKE